MAGEPETAAAAASHAPEDAELGGPAPRLARAAGVLPRALAVLVALWLLYSAGALVLPAAPDAAISQAEAHRLLGAHSLLTDGDLDLLDDYQARAWRSWGGVGGDGPGGTPDVQTTAPMVRDAAGRVRPAAPGGLLEPQGLGIGAALLPGYVAGGRLGAQLWCALLLAGAFALMLPVARRVVPEPWATRGVLAVGVSPPAVLAAGQLGPAAPGAVLLAGAALLALRVRDVPRAPAAAGCALLLAAVPWVWAPLIPAVAFVAFCLARWLRRRRRGLAGFVAVEVLLVSGLVYVTVNDRLYGGPTPWAPESGLGVPTRVDGITAALERAVRPLGWLIDRDLGQLRWAPVLALVALAAWRLLRSRREGLSRAFATQVHVEVVGSFLLLLAAAIVLPVVLLGPPPVEDAWLAGGTAAAVPVLAALVGLGWRAAPRAGWALAALGAVATSWLLAAAIAGGAVGTDPPAGPVPWAGLEALLPRLR